MAPVEPALSGARCRIGRRGPCRDGRARSGSLRVAAGRAVCIVGVVLAPALVPVAGAPKGRLTREYDLKAAFLFNFAQFVEWPKEAFPDERTPITIGVLGDDPFGASLDEIVKGEAVRNRTIVVRRYRAAREIDGCHILFVGKGHGAELDVLRSSPARRSVLTVGESEDFTAASGIVRFVVVENRVRLRIDVAAAKAAGLTISSKLLRQAEIVGAGAVR